METVFSWSSYISPLSVETLITTGDQSNPEDIARMFTEMGDY